MLCLLWATILIPHPAILAQAQHKPGEELRARVKETLKENGQTIRFMKNKGQLSNSDVLYYFEGHQGAVYIEHNRIRFVAIDDTLIMRQPMGGNTPQIGSALASETEQAVKGVHTVSIYMDGGKINPTLRLGESFSTKFNYLLGDTSNEQITGVRAAKDLTLEDVYPGIDLRLYSSPDGSLEFDWIMDAGADYSQVKMRFAGQDSLSIDPDGSLKVGLRFTDLKFHIPESYQVTNQGKTPVSFSFHKTAENIVDFITESKLDPGFPLVIDPILTWGTYFDGNDVNFDQYLFAIQTDPVTKLVYCAGATNRQISTSSPPYDANGYLNTISGLTGTQRVAIVYSLSSDGTDLVDMTLFGPNAVVTGNNVVAYALSLSANRVYIGGRTNIAIPTPGSPFDGSINSGTAGNGDGFVAVFSKDLGTLHYATYLGSDNNETRGVTSIRALSDNSFVAGITTSGALPAGYISAGAAQTGYGGSDDFYIAKFSNYNTLTWGTYLGGASADVFNDLEVFADGRVAFAGFGASTLTEVNGASAATRSTNTNNNDGFLGILNSTGTAFNYLEEVGGSGDDRLYDVAIFGNSLYWTGAGATGFPTTPGVYDTGYNGGLSDVVVGSVSTTGTNYIATFYGTAGDDIGSAVKLVYSVDCQNVISSFFLVFGTTGGDGLPVSNIPSNESFFDPTRNGGLDMFFACFTGNLSTLAYGTYIGGDKNDYLGDTGDPRGANHLWVEGGNLTLGTSTHSLNHTPINITASSFDPVKETNTASADTHILFNIDYTSLLDVDFSDAPATYGAPAHVQDCPFLKIGVLLDTEITASPNALANGDDNNNLADEDGIILMPTFINGGPQNINITVENITNFTGKEATLFGWIDFNSDGKFHINEFTSVMVADGFNGSKILTWSGVTFSGSVTNHYLRIRLTTDVLTDSPGTTAVDERSIASASNGEVEDYLMSALDEADLSITKTDGSATYTPGVGVAYTVVVSNAGPINAVGATINDNAPAGTTITSWTAVFASGATGNASGSGNISETVNVPVGGTITYTVNVAVPGNLTGNLVNTATVTPPVGTPDPTPANNTATDTDTQNSQADLSITKTDGKSTYTAGTTTIYTVIVKNAGPSDVVGASVVDNIPAGTTWTYTATGTAGSSGFTASGSSNISDVVTIPAAGSITYTVILSIPAGFTGNLVNTATVTPPAGTTDPTPDNNTATDTDAPAPAADMSITKTDGVATYTAGTTTTYTVVVTNLGPSTVVGASVVDNIPSGTTWTYTATGTAGSSGFTASGSSNISDVVTIPAAGSITYTVILSIPAGFTGNLVNTATVTPPAGTTDPTPDNNTATDTDAPAPISDLSLVKIVDNASPIVGMNVTFTVTVSNTGPSTATNVTVLDQLPAGLSFQSSTPSQGAYDNMTGIWTIGTINSGASANILITVTVTTPGEKTNYAQVNSSDSSDPDSTPGDDSTDQDDNDEVVLMTMCIIPEFTVCPGSQAVFSCNATTVSYVVSAIGTPTPTLTYVFTGVTMSSGSGTGSGAVFNLGTTNVTITAANVCGSMTCSFTVTVSQPPLASFINPPGNATVACGTSIQPSSLNYSNGLTGPGEISGAVVSVITGVSNVCGSTYQETWTFTDVCNRTIVHTRTITVSPAPLASFGTLPGSTTIACATGTPASTPLSYTNGQVGPCLISGSVNSILTFLDGSCPSRYTETWTFTDICNRTITHSRIVSVTTFWQNANIGAANGSATYSCSQTTPGNYGPFQVTSAGYGSQTSDIAHYIYTQLSGDGTIIVHFNGATNQGFGGIMYRESLAPGAKKASLRTQNSLNNIQREVRFTTNGVEVSQQWQRLHKWLRMDKIGNIIAAYTSPDGINWWSCPSWTTVVLGDCFYVGVFAEGVNANSPSTVTFDVVRITGFNQAPLPIVGNNDPDVILGQMIEPDLVEIVLPSGTTKPKEQEVLEMLVYPNPANSGDALTLELRGVSEGNIRITVYSMQGTLIKTFWMDAAEYTQLIFSLPEIASGVYLIKAEAANRHFVTKRVSIVKK